MVFTSTRFERAAGLALPPAGERLRHHPARTTARQLSVNYGVMPILAPDVSTTDEMLAQMDRVMVEGGYLREGQLVVFLAGQPVGRPGTTNLMKLHRVGWCRKNNVISNVKSQMSRLRRAQSALTPGL